MQHKETQSAIFTLDVWKIQTVVIIINVMSNQIFDGIQAQHARRPRPLMHRVGVVLHHRCQKLQNL